MRKKRMISSIISGGKLENFKKEGIKYFILVFAFVFGLVLSLVLAYRTIDFSIFPKTFTESFSNPDVLWLITKEWYEISFLCLVIAILALVIYACCTREEGETNILTWRQTMILAFAIIMISQVILPMLGMLIVMVIILFYLIICLSILLMPKFGVVINAFIFLVEKICAFEGITLTYGEFIEQERYFIFLTIILVLISIPYLLPFLLRIIKGVIQKAADGAIIKFFNAIEVIINTNVLRYSIYIILFFISIFTYSVKNFNLDYIFSILKEALLEFVLLDTVVYSIISNYKIAMAEHKRKKMIKRYSSIKYDLEFVLSAITIYDLKHREMKARVKFCTNIKEFRTRKQREDVKEIYRLLEDISTNFCEIEQLEKKIKSVLNEIIDLIG